MSEGWAAHVERFGLSFTNSPEIGTEAAPGSVAGNYVMSAFQLASRSVYVKEQKGLPFDISNELAQKWMGRFVREFAERVARTTNDPVTRSLVPIIFREGYLRALKPELRLRTIEALWPVLVESVPVGSRQQEHGEVSQHLRAAYQEAGRATDAEKLLRMLDKPKPANVSSNGPVRLPRAKELEPRFPFNR